VPEFDDPTLVNDTVPVTDELGQHSKVQLRTG